LWLFWLWGYTEVRHKKKKFYTFQAEIANRNSDTIRILNRTNGKELLKIGIDKKGILKEVLQLKKASICCMMARNTRNCI